jgi:hypothetical protein
VVCVRLGVVDYAGIKMGIQRCRAPLARILLVYMISNVS